MRPRILIIDVETSPIESYTWGIWDQNVGLEQIKTEWSIISFAAKWLEEKRVYYSDTSGKGPSHIRNDRKLLGQIWELLDDADIVVAQNGVSFDVKKINARLLMHGFAPYSPIRVVDTLSTARKHFGFTSNKLQWLTEHLTDHPKSKHKKFPGFDLWKECLADNPKAWKEMKKYNIQDVLGTEKLYLKLRAWIAQHPNLGSYSEGTLPLCPKCGSVSVQARGFAVTQHGKYQRYSCNDCGGWSRGKIMLHSLTKRRSLLT